MVSPIISLTFKYSREDYAFLKGMCIKQGISFNACVTQALDELKEKWYKELQRSEKKPDQDFKQVEISSWSSLKHPRAITPL